jgi:hypothetical protein
LAEPDREGQDRGNAFLQELSRLGWIDGKNVKLDGKQALQSLEAATFWPPSTGHRGIPECRLKRQERVRMS